MHVVITGGDGFIGRNLRIRLREHGFTNVTSIDCEDSAERLSNSLATADFVYHLAGVNRPKNVGEFETGNRGLTATVCDVLRRSGRKTPLAFTSSVQAVHDNPYGASKKAAEEAVARYASDTGAAVFVFRLTNVFGKWSRPNYNSAVATFCHNIARGIPITINDPAALLRLVYIDDVVDALESLLTTGRGGSGDVDVGPIYETTVGEVAAMIGEIAATRSSGFVPVVGTGLGRALSATYASFLPPDAFSYPLSQHSDPRGMFAEILKTADTGQFSFFTAHPGITRGGHYHHTKTERFLVVQGSARFRFRQVITEEQHEVIVNSDDVRIVETVPGWAHDITNIGAGELIVMLWANEIFDPARSDTIPAPVV